MMVRCVVGIMARLLHRHRCCVLPAIAIASATTGPAAAPGDGAAHGAPLLVGTPTRALTAPSELHPAGRRHALKPPYPAHRPLLHSLERTWKGAQQRQDPLWRQLLCGLKGPL